MIEYVHHMLQGGMMKLYLTFEQYSALAINKFILYPLLPKSDL